MSESNLTASDRASSYSQILLIQQQTNALLKI